MLGGNPIGTVAYMGGVPAVLESFCWSWGQMIQYNAEFLCESAEYVHYDKARLSLHACARHQIADAMLGDWVVMLDCDHSFDPDVVHRLVRTADQIGAEVLSGLYQFKHHPHSPVAYVWHEGGDLPAPIGGWSDDADVLQVQSVGAGCLFVRRSVFMRIDREIAEGPFDRIKPLGEDHSFCKRCKDLGIDVWLAPKIHSAHLRVAPVKIADFDRDAVECGESSPVKGFER